MFTKRDVEILEGKMYKKGVSICTFIQITEKQDELIVCTGSIKRRYKYDQILEIQITATLPDKQIITALQRDPYPAGLCIVIVDTIKVASFNHMIVELTITSKENCR